MKTTRQTSLCLSLIHIFQPDEKKDGGRYIVSTGRLKRIHEADQVLILADGLRIPIGDIVELESECIRGLL